MRRTLATARARYHAVPSWVRWPVVGLLFVGLVGSVGFALLWSSVELPETRPMPESSVVVTDSGEELAVVAPQGLRTEVGFDDIPPVVVDAVLAAEDQRFWSHGGVDPLGVARALWQNARTDGTQGGSTITQQLVKLSYPGEGRTLGTKLREAVLAVKLDRTVDKERLLERYLNDVYFGRRAYGIEAAARAYFHRSASELELHQAALLAGLIRSPGTAEPLEHPTEAARRRRSVLTAMESTGAITAEQAAAADALPLGAIVPDPPGTRAHLAPHFVDRVLHDAVAAVGEQAVYRGGVRIVTTLDPAAQRAADAAVAGVLDQPTDPQAALVALDTDGAVRAYVGGRDHAALKVDLVRGAAGGGTGRQPGSAFKPLTLAAALQRGVTLADRYSAPPELQLEIEGQPWLVRNYGGAGYGELAVGEATASSVNTVYAQLVAQVGPAAVAEVGRTLGIDSELPAEPSIALGTSEVSPQELAEAYLTLANDGAHAEPYAVVRIEDRGGKVLWEHEPAPPAPALDPAIARAVTHALRHVVTRGSGTGAAIGRPVAGKTGTTQNHVDAWFAGYVPGYAAVVWMGHPDAAVPMESVHGRAATGGSFPATIWARFMSAVLETRPVAEFPPPPAHLLSRPGTPAPPAAAPSGGDAGGGDGDRRRGRGRGGRRDD